MEGLYVVVITGYHVQKLRTILKRVGYIDALRGLTMILVVFSHIYIPNRTIVNQLFINFRMPLFFFISGLLSFRLAQEWTSAELRQRIATKARTLLLPVLIFGTLYIYVGDVCSFKEMILTERKMGYWFTLVLFEMLGIYYLLRYFVARSKREISIPRAIMWLFVVAVGLSFLWSERWLTAPLPTSICLSCLIRFMPFFCGGLLAGCHRETFDRIIDRRSIYLTAIVLFGLLSWGRMKLDGGIDIIICLLVGFAGIVMLYGTFRRLRTRLEDSTLVGRTMQYVGRHTLEVYVIHYFLLLGITDIFYPYVAAVAFPLSPLVVGLPIAITTAGLSLGIGWLLCRNRHIAYYALGKR